METPQKYIRLVNEDGTHRFEILLGEWASDLGEAHEAYDKRLYGDAMMLFGAAGPDAYEKRTPALLNYTGTGPQAVEPVWAAIDGNPWMLGQTDVPDTRLTKYFQKQERVRPSFKPLDDEQLQELEDADDPHATGGKTVAVKKQQRQLVDV